MIRAQGQARGVLYLPEQARFANLDDTRFDDYCGRVATVVGNYTRRGEERLIREVTSVRP